MHNRYEQSRKCFQNLQSQKRERLLDEHKRDLAIVERMEADERAFRSAWIDWE